MGAIVVVGSGIAGDEAARAARRTAPEAEVVLVTDEPHALYSACVLGDYVAGQIPRERVFLCAPEEYARAGIELRLAEPVIDWSPEQCVLHTEDAQIPYQRLILATGSRPVVPPLAGVKKEGVFALKTVSHADRIRETRGRDAVVVGSGPVGIEAALALHRRGWRVCMVELLDRVLPRLLDSPMADLLRACLEEREIRVCLGERVEEIVGGDRVASVRTDIRSLKAELVVFVIGMTPETTLAGKGGLALGASGGILVDEGMGTSLDHVWACGDCVESRDLVTGRTGLFMLWNNARLQGQVAGANAAGGGRCYRGSLNITTVNLGDRAAASVGLLAADLPPGEGRVIYRKGAWGASCLVLREDALVGVQVLGRTERVGGLLGVLLRGGDLRWSFRGWPNPTAGRETWPLRELRKELMGVLGFGRAHFGAR